MSDNALKAAVTIKRTKFTGPTRLSKTKLLFCINAKAFLRLPASIDI
jgi:hypothetical protein